MRRIMIAALLLSLVAAGAFTQVQFTEYEDTFADFATEAADALPFNSTVGLNWSHAHIGQFPHFGVGIVGGFTTMPFEALDSVSQMLGYDLPSQIEALGGAPIPVVALEGRLGGFILPFDVGVKVAVIPEGTNMGDVEANYLSVGLDVRYLVLEGGGLMPDISVGGGYNYVRGDVNLPGPASQTIQGVAGFNLDLTDPALNVNWSTSVIDLKAQASKKLAIITPYIGLGASLGIGTVGGGLSSSVLIGGVAPTPAEIAAIEAFTGEDFDPDQGFFVSFEGEKGWAFRTYGGLSLNLSILKIDLTGMYNFTSSSWGASLGTRVQI